MHGIGCGPSRFPRQHEPWPNKTVLVVQYFRLDKKYSTWAFLAFRDRSGWSVLSAYKSRWVSSN